MALAKLEEEQPTCQGGLKDMLIRASKSGDIRGGAAHIEPYQLQLVRVVALPFCGEGIAHVAPSRAGQDSPMA